MDLTLRLAVSLVVSLALSVAGVTMYRRSVVERKRNRVSPPSTGVLGETPQDPTSLTKALQAQWMEIRDGLMALLESASAERRRLSDEAERSRRIGQVLRTLQEEISASGPGAASAGLSDNRKRMVLLLQERGRSTEEIARELRLGELEVSLYLETSGGLAA